MSARSNGWIENYDCCRKTEWLHILHQNPNLTLTGSYHTLSLQDDSSLNHQQVEWTIPYPLFEAFGVLFCQQSSSTTSDESSSRFILYIIIATFCLLFF